MSLVRAPHGSGFPIAVDAALGGDALRGQQRIETLAKESAKPLFLADQFKVVMKNMAGEPVMPTEEGFGEVEVDAAHR